MIRTLCSAGARVDIEKDNGQTPLMIAVSTAFEAAADELMFQGADVYKTNKEGTSCYDQAFIKASMREWCRKLGIGAGAGASGTGRLHTSQPNKLTPKIGQKLDPTFF